MEQTCYDTVLEDLLFDQDKHCKLSCNVKDIQSSIIKYENEANQQNLFVLQFKFQRPVVSWQSLMNRPFKTVRTETLIMPWLSLIGNIGGTLGMCVGFSFIGTSEWIMTGL